jgi:GGDEF domain-containing protein
MDSPKPSSRAALYQDSLTGLPTVQGWVKELLGSVFPADGSLIACEVAGVASVNQAFGHAAGDLLLREVVARARKALPPTAVLMRGREYTLFAFLPDLSGMVVDAFVSHLRQGVCGNPLALPGGEQIYPKLVTVVQPVVNNTPVLDAVVALERTLVRQPDDDAPGMRRAV